MKCVTKIVEMIALCSLLASSNLTALTCVGKLRIEGKWLALRATAGTLLFPLYGFGVNLMAKSVKNRGLVVKNSARLEAATTIKNAKPSRKTEKAHKVMEEFYLELVELYPETRIGKAEVVDWLHRLNLGGEEPACARLYREPLAVAFFPEHKMNHYLSTLAARSASVADSKKELQEAARIRDEKNRALNLRNARNTGNDN